MSTAAFVLYICNFAYIGILPKIFFKPGKLHLFWWLTAAPFLLSSFSLIAGYFFFLSPLIPSAEWRESLAVVCSVFSIGLISLTLGSHRTRLALWHQEAQPESIVTHAAYRYIRHPFYSSFLLVLLGAAFLFPHAVTILAAGYGYVILTVTAIKEEKFLSTSQFGSEYQQYMKRTGRFWPKFRRVN